MAFSIACGDELEPARSRAAPPEPVEMEKPTFEQLLEEADMVLHPPAGFRTAAAVAEPGFPVDRVMRHEAIKLEVRYGVRPIGRAQIEYSDPHGLAPDPDTLYVMVFRSLATGISTDYAPQRELAVAEAREKFGADWVATTALSTSERFGVGYDYCLFVMMHGSKRADAFVFFLFDDREVAMPEIRSALRSLVFRDLPARKAG